MVSQGSVIPDGEESLHSSNLGYIVSYRTFWLAADIRSVLLAVMADLPISQTCAANRHQACPFLINGSAQVVTN